METRNQAEEDAAHWIGQRETGPWTDTDVALFEAWLNASMSNRAAYYRFNTLWKETGRLKALGESLRPDPVSGAFSDTEWRRERAFAIAAGLLVALSTALFTYRNELFNPGSYATPIGGTVSVPMSDGSRITLNTDSKLRISVDDKQRRIDLAQGEAYFDVAKDPGRPFTVIAGNKRITAVGTAFSVRREKNDVRVVVTEGKVLLESTDLQTPLPDTNRGNGQVLLAAGTLARAQGADILVQKKPLTELEQDLTWRTGVLTFQDTPLADAVAEFNRYNIRKIIIQDPTIAAIQVGGVFRTTNLDRFIHLIEGPLPIEVTHDGDRIFLSAK